MNEGEIIKSEKFKEHALHREGREAYEKLKADRVDARTYIRENFGRKSKVVYTMFDEEF